MAAIFSIPIQPERRILAPVAKFCLAITSRADLFKVRNTILYSKYLFTLNYDKISGRSGGSLALNIDVANTAFMKQIVATQFAEEALRPRGGMQDIAGKPSGTYYFYLSTV